MISVTAAPVNVSNFITRAKGSTMRLSPNKVAVPSPRSTKKPASASKSTASQRIRSACSLRVATPTISNTMAPVARVSSGSATANCRVEDTASPYCDNAMRACSAAASAVW